ncbi:helix-turn-helix transcriptional regulator [Polycladidibacter hongkongensis]|uniref:helix-turn-helix transcriptional regulator n=1 Tax=Polycladidibacter hongkongensis TaxID=1647556 RepID=UPI0008357222|nr:YafY family protein [Pseudovibrio hongkongensis]
MRSERLFKLLDLLRAAHRPRSAASLAQSLAVSERTIYRDIASLQHMGAPIRGESGLGYQIEKGYFLPPLHLSQEEISAISLGTRLLVGRADPALAEAAATALAKINESLPERAKDAYANVPIIAFNSGVPTDAAAHPWLPILRQAVFARRKLEITYISISGTTTQRVIRPLGLTVFPQSWILTAWCELRGSFRNFRVDLIKGVLQTETAFRRELGKEFHDFLKTVTPS